MNLLPPPGPERRRLVVMVVALLVIAVAYFQWGGTPELVIPTSTGPAATPAPTRVQAPPRSTAGQARRLPASGEGPMPQPLKLAEMEQVPDEPQVGRNPFRFGVPPPPPPPPYVPPPPTPTPVYTPPPPPPIPPIPLKLTLIIPPHEKTPVRAYLTDPKTGQTFEGVEGQIIDGRYRLLKVATSSVVMSYLDGTGQRVINLGG